MFKCEELENEVVVDRLCIRVGEYKQFIHGEKGGPHNVIKFINNWKKNKGFEKVPSIQVVMIPLDNVLKVKYVY